MPRGRWCILVAFVGWLSLAASPPQQRRTEAQAHASQNAEQSLRDIAAALNRQNETGDYQRECQRGQDNRNSDLCAQWKAADAAYESSVWTRRTFWLGVAGIVVGFLTLVAAGFAAVFAWMAAKAARDSVEHSQNIASIQLRAYLDISDPKLELFPERDTDDVTGFKATVTFHNYGQTPAREIKHRLAFGMGENPPSDDAFDDVEWIRTAAISQGDHFEYFDFFDVVNEDLIALTAPESVLALWMRIQYTYEDVFGASYSRACDLFSDDAVEWVSGEDQEEKIRT